MTSDVLSRSLAIGAMTGIRSASGLAALAYPYGGPVAALFTVAAVAETVADKMPFIGNRTDPAPLAGRVLLAALAGGFAARQRRRSPIAGAALAASTAFIAAHVATRLRTEVASSPIAGGVVEDGIVLALASIALRPRP